MAFASPRERDETIVAAHYAGRTGKWIRREYKVASATILKALTAAGINKPRHPRQKTDWTDAMVETMKRLWATGASFQAIAEATGSTRRSVERKGSSLGLKHKPAAKGGPRVVDGAPAKRSHSKPVRKIAVDEPPSLDLTLMDLEQFQCRWITAETGAAARFCGHPSSKPYGYCEAHHAIAYVPADLRPRTSRTDYHLFRRAA